ncbi:MAG: DNA repair protein RecO [Microthrixaceae bacterium]|nr:DNA repair protein RecO [Microthrixaceae bacterium]
MPLIRDSAVVVRTHKLGEADRIVVLLTEGRGRLRSVAKGVRRTGSKFGSRLEPGSHVAVQLHEGRSELLIVTQVERIDTYSKSRADLDRMAAVAAILEVAEQLGTDGGRDSALYRKTVGVLRTIEERPGPLVVPAFFLRLLQSDGVGFELTRCVSCGERAELVAIDPVAGGAQCRSCATGMALSADALGVLRAVSDGRVNDVLADAPVAVGEVTRVAQVAMETHLERRLRVPGATGW